MRSLPGQSSQGFQPAGTRRLLTQAVFLDAGGVFTLPPLEAVVRALIQLGIPANLDLISRAHYAGMAGYDRAAATPGEHWTAYLECFAARAGAPDPAGDSTVRGLREAFAGNSWTPAIRDSIAALPDLVASGAKVAIVSNSNGTVAARMRDHGICQVGPGPGIAIDAIIDSGTVGVEKPDPRIFEIALAAVGVRAADAVHVGDSVWTDVGGARAAGIRAIHFDPYRLCPEGAHDHVTSLRQVPSLLG